MHMRNQWFIVPLHLASDHVQTNYKFHEINFTENIHSLQEEFALIEL